MDAIVRHAREAAPAECCGVLIGSAQFVEEACAARNVAERPDARFLIDPQDHFAAIRHARERGFSVVGFYHSHPRSAPEPSETDRAEASYPDHLHVIVSLAGDAPELRLYRYGGGNFLALPLVTVR